jgi:hypothetical protein
MTITIGPGITLGTGVDIGGISFTVNPGDITYNEQLYGGYSSYSSAGFTCDGNRDTYNGIIYETTTQLHDIILSAWLVAGFDPTLSYAYNVSFASGGNIIARVAVNPNGIANSIAIVPIDQTNTSWQSGSPGGPTLAGTWTFPAVFTPYAPTTSLTGSNNWC